jgi:response regulator RpfG family c-di-GMP phosphodiesterase
MSSTMKILYIDDEAINVSLFNINFKRNYNVLAGYSGFEGLEILENHPDIKVIISDMKMPGMNGIQFVNKAKEKYPDKRFFILTGFEITAEIQEALDKKLVEQYFRKPFNMKEIEKAINKQG